MAPEECISGSSGEYCSCFFDTVTYTFDGSGVDWANTNFVSLRVTPVYSYGSREGSDVALTTSARTATVDFTGCPGRPAIRIDRRTYSMRGAVMCTYMDGTFLATSVTIPAATLSGSTCSAPPPY